MTNAYNKAVKNVNKINIETKNLKLKVNLKHLQKKEIKLKSRL